MDGEAVAVAKKKTSEKRKFNTLVRMDDELCEMARKLASLRGTSMAELFSVMFKPVIAREYEKELAKESKKLKGSEEKA